MIPTAQHRDLPTPSRAADRRTGRRTPALSLVFVGLVLLLAGCMNLTANLQVSADNQISGSIDMAISKELAAVAGITSAEQLKEQMTKGGDIPAGMTVTTSSDDKSLILTLTGDLSQTEGLFTATSKDGIQTFTVTNNQDTSVQDASSLPTGDYKITVTANFSATVTKVTPQFATIVDANTVEFSGPVMTPWKATATVDLAKPVSDPADASTTQGTPGSGSKGSGLGTWLSLLALTLLLIGAIVALAIGARAHRSSTPTSDTPAAPLPEPAADPATGTADPLGTSDEQGPPAPTA